MIASALQRWPLQPNKSFRQSSKLKASSHDEGAFLFIWRSFYVLTKLICLPDRVMLVSPPNQSRDTKNE